MMYGFSCHCCLPSGPHPYVSGPAPDMLAPGGMHKHLLHVRHFGCSRIHVPRAVYLRCSECCLYRSYTEGVVRCKVVLWRDL